MDCEWYNPIPRIHWSADHQPEIYHYHIVSCNNCVVCEYRNIMGLSRNCGCGMISVAAGMGAPLPAVAGAIVAGAYFGDKMSPLSDSTNMSAIATGTNLYKHIGHLFYTTIRDLLSAALSM